MYRIPFEEAQSGRRFMNRNITMSIGGLIILIIVVAIIF